jgi:transposase
MTKGYLRCVDCKSDYNPFKDTWLSTVKIDHVKWLVLIKLFDLGISARQSAREASISYPTALHVFDCIRYSILHRLADTDKQLKGEIEDDEAYFGGKRKGNRGRGAKNKTIVFGILERKGKVSVQIVDNVSAKTLLSNTIKKVRKGSIVYTDKWRGYDSLVFSGYKHLSIDHQKIFAKGKVYINGIEGFWSFAKERMAKHHGVSPDKFLLYIKEMEWRYNNRDEDTFSLLVDYILGEDN